MSTTAAAAHQRQQMAASTSALDAAQTSKNLGTDPERDHGKHTLSSSSSSIQNSRADTAPILPEQLQPAEPKKRGGMR